MRYQAEAKRERVEIAHDYYQSGARAFLERDWDRARQNFVLLEAMIQGIHGPTSTEGRFNANVRLRRHWKRFAPPVTGVISPTGWPLLREFPPTVLFEQDVGGLKRALMQRSIA